MSIRIEENESQETTCPFCHAPIACSEATWACPRCETVHHAECARDNGRCTVLGCAGAPTTEAATAVRRARFERALARADRFPRGAAPPSDVFLADMVRILFVAGSILITLVELIRNGF